MNENRYQKRIIKEEKENNSTSQETYAIIDFLTKEAGGNVHNKGVVNVTSSPIIHDNYHPKNAVDIHNNNYFYSQNVQNAWLKYDFIQRKVHPISYSITTRHGGSNVHHPRNWVIEGSNNDNDWTILDFRKDETSLN